MEYVTILCNHRSNRVEDSDEHFCNTLTTTEHCLSAESVACLYKLQTINKLVGYTTHSPFDKVFLRLLTHL